MYHVDGTLVHTFEGHTNKVHALATTQDGQHIISGSNDNLVKVWSVATKSLGEQLRHRACQQPSRRGGGDARRPALPQRRVGNSRVEVWRLNGTHENAFMELHTGAVRAVALLDNQHALAASGHRKVKLFNVNDGAVLRTFHSFGGVNSLALMPDGLRFIAGANDTKARIFYHGLAPQ